MVQMQMNNEEWPALTMDLNLLTAAKGRDKKTLFENTLLTISGIEHNSFVRYTPRHNGKESAVTEKIKDKSSP